MSDQINISPNQLHQVFHNILLQHGFAENKAEQCAAIFTANSVDGIYTHGVNRFPRFVQYIRDKHVEPNAELTFVGGFGSMEQWNGNKGPGPLNAVAATERAMELAANNGIGCVALSNTNHWMRGGYYGWQAAKKGFVFIGWSNTTANMPAWGAVEAKLGNNPLVIALPFGEEAIVLDMAQSQFSFGIMEQAVKKGELLPVAGGFDQQNNLTNNPAKIMEANRPLPIGYWKGTGLALLLDILAAILSGGKATHQISQQPAETDVSQVFIAIDLNKLPNHSSIQHAIRQIVDDYSAAATLPGEQVRYPGASVLRKGKQNKANGVPVLKEVWEAVQALVIK